MINKSKMFIAIGSMVTVMAVSLTGAEGIRDQYQANSAGLSTSHGEKSHIVFLVSEDPDNYEAHKTVPPFADMLEKEEEFKVTVIQGEGERHAFSFPRLEEVLPEADLVVVFARRIALRSEQMDMIKNHLRKGKPLVGIRTANHAFSVREEKIPEGYEDWWEFVPDILGAENRGYGPTALGTEVNIAPGAKGHPILDGFEPDTWHSQGNVYHTAPLLDKKATVLLTGQAGDMSEPIAWIRNANGSRVFYTSLGYPKDFKVPQFRQLLINGIKWSLDLL